MEPPANDDPALLKPLSGDAPVGEDPTAEELLAAALRGRVVSDAGAEARAVAAFRAARDAGAHAVRPARSRRRDDWRPREQRKVGRSLRTTLAVLFASLTLGGVAVAGIGSVSDDGDAGRGGTRPSSSAAPERSEPGPANPTPPGSGQAAPSGRPSQAQDTEAHCRAYDAVKGRGQALSSTAWQRLIEAAGGEGNVESYCAGQLDDAATRAPGKADSTPKATPKPRKSKNKG